MANSERLKEQKLSIPDAFIQSTTLATVIVKKHNNRFAASTLSKLLAVQVSDTRMMNIVTFAGNIIFPIHLRPQL
jgi:hypothetical protein